jgi:PAS domain S-box-containing protein
MVKQDHDALKGPRKALQKEASRRKAAESALRESEKRLSQIVDGSPIPTFVIDENHVIIHCNKAFERLTGISARDFIGSRKQWMAFYPQERRVLADFIVDQASAAEIERHYGGKYRPSAVIEGAYEAEDFFPRLGSQGKWVYFTAAPLKDPEGRVVGAIETLQDVTDRKRAEEDLRDSERRLRILLDFVPYPIVVFTLDGRVYYVNPAFTETFGWTLTELAGKRIPYSPPGLEEETRDMIARLLKEKIVLRHETKRLTKDGRLLDVVMRAGVYSESKEEPAGELVILRDITQEKKAARIRESLQRISLALPEYPDLEELLDYISGEVKRLLDTEGALVILPDEEGNELYFLGADYDDPAITQRAKGIRFPVNELVAGKVLKSGKSILLTDEDEASSRYEERDRKLGYHTRNLLLVPLRSSDRIIGVLCATNKKTGAFDRADEELLSMIAGTVTLSIENARFSEDVRKAYRTTDALLRISMALPEHPDLADLLDFVSGEVKRLLNAEGALVILPDEPEKELFFLGAAYDDPAIKMRAKRLRFPLDRLVAGKVFRDGRPMIVTEGSEDPEISRERDEKLGYHTRNLLLVPLRSKTRVTGVLSAINKKDGEFTRRDQELLSLIAGTVALSIENARFSDDLKKAYEEVTSLNRAKDKVINHLSHELKTPVSVLAGSLNILSKRMVSLPEESWKPTIERARRNLDRIIEIQYQTEDIMEDRRFRVYDLLNLILNECADTLETLLAQKCGEGAAVSEIRRIVDEVFGSKERVPAEIALHEFVPERIASLRAVFAHRAVDLRVKTVPAPLVYLPRDVLQKVVDGLVRNAIENTPDGGKVEVEVHPEGRGAALVVKDFGVGILEEHQKRIFEGFFTTRETLDYSSMRPFDFNAGGKGADLLRMKIFSERFHFRIQMTSSRCKYLGDSRAVCPGNVAECKACSGPLDCFESGGTTFVVSFPGRQEGVEH